MSGHDRLWRWFALSYASWLTLPRILMHAMPDDWQDRMAQLLEEYNEAFDTSDCGIDGIYVSAKRGNKFCALPQWTSRHSYRHPPKDVIDAMRRKP
jgi:hypothetical protein